MRNRVQAAQSWLHCRLIKYAFYGGKPNEEREIHNFHIYNSCNVTGEILRSRTQSEKIIIERVIALITNAEREGDANVLNTNGDYNYISYYGSDLDYTTGTVMITYLMYNPETDYEDDIIERYDFVLDRNFED